MFKDFLLFQQLYQTLVVSTIKKKKKKGSDFHINAAQALPPYLLLPLHPKPLLHTLYTITPGFFLLLICATLIPSQGHLHVRGLLHETPPAPWTLQGWLLGIIYLLEVLLEESPWSSCYVRNTRYTIMHIVYYHSVYFLKYYLHKNIHRLLQEKYVRN